MGMEDIGVMGTAVDTIVDTIVKDMIVDMIVDTLVMETMGMEDTVMDRRNSGHSGHSELH